MSSTIRAIEPAAAAAVTSQRALSPKRSRRLRRASSAPPAGGVVADDASTSLASHPPRAARRRFTIVSPDFHQMSTLGDSDGGDTRSVSTTFASVEVARPQGERPLAAREVVFDIDDLGVRYGDTTAFS